MKSKKSILSFLFITVFTMTAVSASFAQGAMKSEDSMKKDTMMSHDSMMKDDTRPIVAVIKADWCSYCKRIDPVVSGLMKDYSEKLNFVVFDVTNDATKAEAKAHAEKLGLSKFYDEYKGKTSTVAVLKDKKIAYKTSNNGERDDYIAAFNKVLK